MRLNTFRKVLLMRKVMGSQQFILKTSSLCRFGILLKFLLKKKMGKSRGTYIHKIDVKAGVDYTPEIDASQSADDRAWFYQHWELQNLSPVKQRSACIMLFCPYSPVFAPFCLSCHMMCHMSTHKPCHLTCYAIEFS